MAEIDFAAFGAALSDRLDGLGYSLAEAARKWPDTDRAMLSRATRGATLSAGNYLLLCHLAGLDAYAFQRLDKRRPERRITLKTIRKQVVTRQVSRVTQEKEARR